MTILVEPPLSCCTLPISKAKSVFCPVLFLTWLLLSKVSCPDTGNICLTSSQNVFLIFIYYSVCVLACMPECAYRGPEDCLGGSVLSFHLVGLGAGIPVIHLDSGQHCSLSFALPCLTVSMLLWLPFPFPEPLTCSAILSIKIPWH